jgi:hypothetical protein
VFSYKLRYSDSFFLSIKYYLIYTLYFLFLFTLDPSLEVHLQLVDCMRAKLSSLLLLSSTSAKIMISLTISLLLYLLLEKSLYSPPQPAARVSYHRTVVVDPLAFNAQQRAQRAFPYAPSDRFASHPLHSLLLTLPCTIPPTLRPPIILALRGCLVWRMFSLEWLIINPPINL